MSDGRVELGRKSLRDRAAQPARIVDGKSSGSRSCGSEKRTRGRDEPPLGSHVGLLA